LARIYEAFPLTCPQCGTEMRIVAFIASRRPLYSGFSATSANLPCRRGSLQHEDLRYGGDDDSGTTFFDEERFTGDPLAQPEPAYEFDRRVSW